jgi:cell fate regulator YaaT (PSP1 superfamily)
MPIVPLPQFEADLEEDRKIYERLKPPTSIVVRFGAMKMVGEFPYSGDAKPGCGSKLVVRTHRGTELGEMLTSTCPNSGCSKSVSRKDMLEYIENSGGKDYPFFSQGGKVLRIATAEDINEQTRLDSMKVQATKEARALAERMGLPCKIVDCEPILGQERLTFFFVSEDRIDFRDLAAELGSIHKTRIELRQVGARDEARLTADYERCGQHCCCKSFLKVLKPISMRSAKVQKATLDPLKISGRCGRLMCCLRYEDETYEDLRKRLPRKKSAVSTPHGDGVVIDSQILTQLVLVRLDATGEDVAVPVEELQPVGTPRPAPAEPDDDLGDAPAGDAAPARPAQPPSRGQRPGAGPGPRPGPPRREGPPRDGAPSEGQREGPRDGPRDGRRDGRRADRPRPSPAGGPPTTSSTPPPTPPPPADIPSILDLEGDGHDDDGPDGSTQGGGPDQPGAPGTPGQPGSGKRRRRRRRRGPRPPGAEGQGPGGPTSSGPPPSGPPSAG